MDLILNEYVFVSFKDLRDFGFTTTNGTVRGAKRLNRKYHWHTGRRRPFTSKWRLEIEPTDPASYVKVVLNKKECNERGSICDRKGRKPDGSASIELDSQATESTLKVSINDTSVAEDAGRMPFTAELTFSPQDIVVVHFRTTDYGRGTATPWVDYRPGEKILIFTSGERMLDLEVGIIDDAVDDAGETIFVEITSAELVKRNPYRRIPIAIKDGTAVGTITANSDPLQRMWLSRFGRGCWPAGSARGQRLTGRRWRRYEARVSRSWCRARRKAAGEPTTSARRTPAVREWPTG